MGIDSEIYFDWQPPGLICTHTSNSLTTAWRQTRDWAWVAIRAGMPIKYNPCKYKRHEYICKHRYASSYRCNLHTLRLSNSWLLSYIYTCICGPLQLFRSVSMRWVYGLIITPKTCFNIAYCCKEWQTLLSNWVVTVWASCRGYVFPPVTRRR